MQPEDAAAVAQRVSLSYPAAHFLILRIGLLGGHSITAQELVALEAGVQRSVARLEEQVVTLKQELQHERVHQGQHEGGANMRQAELEVQLSVSQASERALQQMVQAARADNKELRRQLHDTQVLLAGSQQAVAAATEASNELRLQVQQQLDQLQQQEQQQTQKQQQQPAEVMASTPVSCKPQAPLQPDLPGDTAADAIRQQDQQDQRTPQARQQHTQQPWHADALAQGLPSPLLPAQPDVSLASAVTATTTPGSAHLHSPLLSPSPGPGGARCSGRASPITPQLRSRIPVAPEPAAALAAGSYAAALKQQARGQEGAAGGADVKAAEGRITAGAGGAAGSKPPVFKFTAAPCAAVTPRRGGKLFGTVFKPFTAGAAPPGTASSRFGSNGTGSRSRRAIRSAQGAGSSSSQPRQQEAAQRCSSKQSKGTPELPDSAATDSHAEARKRRWR